MCPKDADRMANSVYPDQTAPLGAVIGSALCVHSYLSQYFDFFSSPEHEVLMVNYCDQSLSVVRALSSFCFKRLLLQNG